MDRPHILLITADQLRKDALGCYGQRAVHTPHLDSLAQSGIRFEKAYATSPCCLPSRCSILTGRHPHQNGAYSNFRDCAPDPASPNMFHALKAAGYHTALVGKCHFTPCDYGVTRPDKTLPYDKEIAYYGRLGLDQCILQDDKQVSVWFYDDYARDLDKAGHLRAYRDAVWNKAYARVFPFPGPSEWHPDSWVGRKSRECLQSSRSGQPRFLWVSFSGPHFPFDAPRAYYDRVDMNGVGTGNSMEGEFDDPERIHHGSFHGPGDIEACQMAPARACKHYTEDYWRTLRRNYFANVAQIDEEVGKLLQAVREHLGENVLILFTADHGEMLGNHRLWGKHHCAYEDVLNVPLLVKYPDAHPGSVTHARVMLTDVTATCMKAAGADLPGLAGRDLREHIAHGGEAYTFAETEGFAVVSDGLAKYVHLGLGDTQKAEFFDLRRDPHEYENRIRDPQYAVKISEMRRVLLSRFMAHLLS